MSQNVTDSPISPVDTNGTELAAELDGRLQAFLTTNAGASAPSYAKEGGLWWDSTNDLMYVHDGSVYSLLGAKIGALPLATGGTVSGSIEVTGDGNTIKAPRMIVNPDPAVAIDIAEIEYHNKSDVKRATTRLSSDNTFRINLYDGSEVYQDDVVFSVTGSYSQATAGYVKADVEHLGPGANSAAHIRNDRGGYVLFGNLYYVNLDLSPNPKRLYIADSTNTYTYYIATDGTSDMRLKENVQPLEIDALADVLAMDMFQHDWNDLNPAPGHVPIAISAQQAQEVAPDTVFAGERAGNSPLDFDPLNINLYPWVMRCMRAIQQQQETINKLQERIAALEA